MSVASVTVAVPSAPVMPWPGQVAPIRNTAAPGSGSPSGPQTRSVISTGRPSDRTSPGSRSGRVPAVGMAASPVPASGRSGSMCTCSDRIAGTCASAASTTAISGQEGCTPADCSLSAGRSLRITLTSGIRSSRSHTASMPSSGTPGGSRCCGSGVTMYRSRRGCTAIGDGAPFLRGAASFPSGPGPPAPAPSDPPSRLCPGFSLTITSTFTTEMSSLLLIRRRAARASTVMRCAREPVPWHTASRAARGQPIPKG